MGIIPSTVQDQLDFFDQHQDQWQSVATSIGLTSAQATAFKTAANAARSAYNNQLAAEAAKLAATNTATTARRAARVMCAELIAVIKGYANQQANPNRVYDDAQIPAPATPTPAPAPGTPFDFTVELLQSGAITLRWKCTNPAGTSGTIYEVRRRANQTSGTPFVFIGATGTREFTDDTLGSTAVTYEITAVRSTRRGNPATWNVSFGTGGAGFTVQQLQMAA